MDCSKNRKQLARWLDGELSTSRAAFVARHVAACEACRQQVCALQQVTDALNHLPPIPAPGRLSRTVMAAYRTHFEKPGMAEWWQSLNLAMRSALCGAALAGLLCGAVLGTSLSALAPDMTSPYQTLYASKGILP